MNLLHYTDAPLTFDPARTYEQDEPSSYRKPHGFWVSVEGEDDWPSWCRGELFATDRLAHVSRVTLAADAHVHVISDASALDAFTGTYAVQTDWERRFAWKRDDRSQWPIDWREVVKDCDGLIIAPYIYTRRMATEWYYGWDCASGCIWNLSAIASVEPAAIEVAS